MRLFRRLMPMLTAALLLCAMSVSAFAHQVPDLDQKGSISLTMAKGSTIVPGGSLTLYRVGEVCEEDGNYSFRPTGDFADYDQPLEDVQSAELAEDLAEYVKNHHLTGTTKTIGQDGKIVFPDLELGLYLLVQNQAAEGYSKAEPFLVTVPMQEKGAYVYQVDASPKVAVEQEKKPTSPNSPKPGTPGQTRLPQTGQLNWPVPVLVVLGLGLFSIGWMLRFGARKDSREK